MSETRIAQRYARALLQTAERNKKDPGVYLPVLEMIESLYEDESIRRFLQNPVMPLEVKRSVVDYAIQRADGGADIKNFTEIILDAGRVAMFPAVAGAYRRMIHELKGIEEGTVTSVIPLSEDDLAKLSEQLSATLGRKVTLKQSVDKSLLGGFVVRIGNYLVDHSLRSKLEALAENAIH